jgi:hypothetical protein
MSGLRHMQVHVLPHWIHRAIIRNKLNLTDIQNYSTVRRILSLDDMAVWEYLNTLFTLDRGVIKYSISSTPLADLFSITSSEERIEYDSHIIPLSGSPDMAASIKERLSAEDNTDDAYSIILDGHIVYVVLHAGFLTHVANDANMLTFVQQYLKNCYKLDTVPNVALLSLFRLYIELI